MGTTDGIATEKVVVGGGEDGVAPASASASAVGGRGGGGARPSGEDGRSSSAAACASSESSAAAVAAESSSPSGPVLRGKDNCTVTSSSSSSKSSASFARRGVDDAEDATARNGGGTDGADDGNSLGMMASSAASSSSAAATGGKSGVGDDDDDDGGEEEGGAVAAADEGEGGGRRGDITTTDGGDGDDDASRTTAAGVAGVAAAAEAAATNTSSSSSSAPVERGGEEGATTASASAVMAAAVAVLPPSTSPPRTAAITAENADGDVDVDIDDGGAGEAADEATNAVSTGVAGSPSASSATPEVARTTTVEEAPVVPAAAVAVAAASEGKNGKRGRPNRKGSTTPPATTTAHTEEEELQPHRQDRQQEQRRERQQELQRGSRNGDEDDGQTKPSQSPSPPSPEDHHPRLLSHDVDDVGVDDLPPPLLHNNNAATAADEDGGGHGDGDGDGDDEVITAHTHTHTLHAPPPPPPGPTTDRPTTPMEQHPRPMGRDPADSSAGAADDAVDRATTTATAANPAPAAPKKRGRGRPPGSKNKKKKVPKEEGGGGGGSSAPAPAAKKRGRKGGGRGGTAAHHQQAAAIADAHHPGQAAAGGTTGGTDGVMNLSCEEVGVEDSEQLAATAASLMAMDDDEEVVAAAALMFFEMSAHDKEVAEAAAGNDHGAGDGQQHPPTPSAPVEEGGGYDGGVPVHDTPSQEYPPPPPSEGEEDDDSDSSESESGSDGGPDPLWLIFFERLRTYRDENGHCRVPAKYPDDPGLGRWVARQRIYRRNTLLADEVGGGDGGDGGDDTEEGAGKVFRTSELIKPDCVKLLDSIGFEWKLPRARRRRASSAGAGAGTADKESASAERRANAAANATASAANAAAAVSAAEAEKRSIAARDAELRFQAAKRAAEEKSLSVRRAAEELAAVAASSRRATTPGAAATEMKSSEAATATATATATAISAATVVDPHLRRGGATSSTTADVMSTSEKDAGRGGEISSSPAAAADEDGDANAADADVDGGSSGRCTVDRAAVGGEPEESPGARARAAAEGGGGGDIATQEKEDTAPRDDDDGTTARRDASAEGGASASASAAPASAAADSPAEKPPPRDEVASGAGGARVVGGTSADSGGGVAPPPRCAGSAPVATGGKWGVDGNGSGSGGLGGGTPTAGTAASGGGSDDGAGAVLLDSVVPDDGTSPNSGGGGGTGTGTTTADDFRRITFTVSRANHDVPWGITLVPIRNTVGSRCWDGTGFGGVAVGYAAPPSPLVKGDVIVSIGELGEVMRTTTTSNPSNPRTNESQGDWYLWFKHVGAMFQRHTGLHVEVARKVRRIGSSSAAAADDDDESMMIDAIYASSGRNRVEAPRLPPMEFDPVDTYGKGEAVGATSRDNERRSIDVAPRTQSPRGGATRVDIASTADGANSEPSVNPTSSPAPGAPLPPRQNEALNDPVSSDARRGDKDHTLAVGQSSRLAEQRGASYTAATGDHNVFANVKDGEQRRSPRRPHDDQDQEETAPKIPSPPRTDSPETVAVMASNVNQASSDQTSAATFTGPSERSATAVSRKRSRSGSGHHEGTSLEEDMPPPPPPPGVMLRDQSAEDEASAAMQGKKEGVAQCDDQPPGDHPPKEEGTRKVNIGEGTMNNEATSSQDEDEANPKRASLPPRTTPPSSGEREDTRCQPSQTTDTPNSANAAKYSHLTGKRVAKKFPPIRKGGRKKVYRGTIGGFVPYSGDEKDVDNLDWFLVEYDDGDSEHVAWEDLQEMLQLYDKVGEGGRKKSDRTRAISLRGQERADAEYASGGDAAETNQKKISSSPKSTATAPNDLNEVMGRGGRKADEQNSTAKAHQICVAGPEAEAVRRIDAETAIEEKNFDDKHRGEAEDEVEDVDDVKPTEEKTFSDGCRTEGEQSCVAECKGGHPERLGNDGGAVDKAADTGKVSTAQAEHEPNAELRVEGEDRIPAEKTMEKKKLEEKEMTIQIRAEQKRIATLAADEEKRRLDEIQRKAEQDRIGKLNVEEFGRNAAKKAAEEEAMEKRQLVEKNGAEPQRGERLKAEDEMRRVEEERCKAEQKQISRTKNEEIGGTTEMKAIEEMRPEEEPGNAKRKADRQSAGEYRGEEKKQRLDEERGKEDESIKAGHGKGMRRHIGSTTVMTGAESIGEANVDHEPPVEKTGADEQGKEQKARPAPAKVDKEPASTAKGENKEPTVAEMAERRQVAVSKAKSVRRTESKTSSNKETAAEEGSDERKTKSADSVVLNAGTDSSGSETVGERIRKRARMEDDDRTAAQKAVQKPTQTLGALSEYSSMIGQRVAKRFSDLKVYEGSIARIDNKEGGGIMFLIEYKDGDSEHVEWEQLKDMRELFRSLDDKCGNAPSSAHRSREAENAVDEGKTEKNPGTSLSTMMMTPRREDHNEIVARKTRAAVLSSTNCHGGVEFGAEEKKRRLEQGSQQDYEQVSNEDRNGKVGHIGSRATRKWAERNAEAKGGHDTLDWTECNPVGKPGQQTCGKQGKERSVSAKMEKKSAVRRKEENKQSAVVEVVEKRHVAASKVDHTGVIKENEMESAKAGGKHKTEGAEVARAATRETDAAGSAAAEYEDRASVQKAVQDPRGRIGPRDDYSHLIGQPVAKRFPESGGGKKTKLCNGSIARMDNDEDGGILFFIKYMDGYSEQVEWDELQGMMELCRSLGDKGGSAPHPSRVFAAARRSDGTKGEAKAGKTEKNLAASLSSSTVTNEDHSAAVPKSKRTTRATVVSTTNVVENLATTGRKRRRRSEKDYSYLVGRPVAKKFPTGNKSKETEVFKGEVTSVESDEDGGYLFRISYEDGDGEEVEWSELQGMFKLFDEVGDRSVRSSQLVWEGEPTESLPDGRTWPPGWRKEVYQRRDGRRYGCWFPPGDSIRLRSMKEVLRYLLERDADSSTEAEGRSADGSLEQQYAHLIGSPVAKMFPTKGKTKNSELFGGSVVCVDKGEDDSDLFHIKYDDGDSEDVEWDELQEMMRLVQEVPDSGTDEMPRRSRGKAISHLVGKPVAKRFPTKGKKSKSDICKGSITRVDSGDLFFVEYEDGNSEHVDRDDLVDMFALALEVEESETEDDSPSATRTEAPIVQGRLRTGSTLVSPSPFGSVRQSPEERRRTEAGTCRNANARSEANPGGGATRTAGSAEGSPRRIDQERICAQSSSAASPYATTRQPVAATCEREMRETAGYTQLSSSQTEGHPSAPLQSGSGHGEVSDHPEDQTRQGTGQASISSLQESSLDTVGEEFLEDEDLNVERRATSSEQHTSLTEQHATSTEQHATSTEQHTTSTEQHATSIEQHTTSTESCPQTMAGNRGRKRRATVLILLLIVCSAGLCLYRKDNHNHLPPHSRPTLSGNKQSQLTDFAAVRRGASIIATKTSPSLVDQLPLYNRVMAKLGLRFYGHPPEMSLSEARTSDAQGQCWAVWKDPDAPLVLDRTGGKDDEQHTLTSMGRMASLTIKLSEPVRVMRVTVVHPTKDETSNPNAAIREFRVIGYQDAKAEGRPFFLGSFVYDIDAPDSMQEFPIAKTRYDAVDVPEMRSVTLAMDSNWGNDFSCLYRFQVHGGAD